MNLQKTLHKFSYLKWLFLTALIILIFYNFFVLPDNLVSNTGIIIYISGIYLGLDSISSFDKMSEKQIELYAKSHFAEQQFKIIIVAIILLVIISTTFMLLKYIFPSKSGMLFNDFFELGLNCWALILGFLCLLKSISDKDSFAKSKYQND